MKYIVYIIISASLLFVACQSQKENVSHEHGSEQASAEVPVDTIKKSVPKEEHKQIGGTHFMLKYHAPAVRGRTIWGGLVPYGEVWVTGAHSATTLEIDKGITINGTTVAAGKYAFFTIPGKDKWTLIINKNWDQHLADEYDAKDDVIRVDVSPEVLQQTQERLKYSITDAANSNAAISMSWEKVKVTLPIQLN
jgi:hypothetical protein